MAVLDSELQDVALELAMLHFARSNAKSAAEVAKLLRLRKPLFRRARRLTGLRAEMSILFCALVITQANRLLDPICTRNLVDMFLKKSQLVVFRELEKEREAFQSEYSEKMQDYFSALQEEKAAFSVSLTFILNVGGKLEIERQMQVINLVSTVLEKITAILERLRTAAAPTFDEYDNYHDALSEIVAKLEAALLEGSSTDSLQGGSYLRALCELIAYSAVRRVRDLYGKQVDDMAWNSFRHSIEIRLCEVAGDSPFNNTLEVHKDGSRSFISQATPWLSRLTEIDSLIDARSQRGPLDASFALASVGLKNSHFSVDNLNQIDEVLYEAESTAQSFILPDIITGFS